MLLTAIGASLAIAAQSLSAAVSSPSDCQQWFESSPADTITRDTTQGATITGVVRNSTFGTPVSGARVDLTDLSTAVCSDSAGTYQLTGVSPGTVMMRITRAGYDTMSVLVTVSARGSLRVDIALSPQMVVLDSVRVHGSPTAAHPMPIGGGWENSDTWSWRTDPGLSLASTGEPDIMRTLSADPHLAVRPDWPGSLMDRGGTSDQLLVRLDGLPVWSPVHGSGTLSAISPDAVGSVTVHDGAIPANLGDRLGGVVDVETRAPPVLASTGAASLGPAATRATWAHPLALGDATGGFRIAVRHSNDDLLANDAGPLRDHWNDGVATAELGTSATTVRFIVVASGDRASPYRDSPSTDAPSSNDISWSTGTLGLVWTQHLGAQVQMESHVSAARFSATVPAAADSTRHSLGDGVSQAELATQLTWASVRIGASLEVLNDSYRVLDAALPAAGSSGLTTDLNRSPLGLVGTPTIVSAFAERRWGSADSSWRITTGVRGMAILGLTARLEPRVDGELRLLPGLIATVGYARTHQAVQSLRNAESPLGAEIGVDLPVVAGTGRVPLTQSDVGTAGIVAQLGAAGRLSVDGYARALSGLAVADPLQRSLFAATGFARASAHVDGLAAQLNGAHGRLRWQAGYGVGRTIESAAGVSYHATSEIGQTGSAALGITVDRLTQVRLAGWAGFGERAPGLDGTVLGHDDDDPVTGPRPVDRDLSSSWAVAARLPPYLRADLQLAHQWQTGPARGHLSTFVTLANIFNHANLAGEVPTSPGGSLRGLTLMPRTVLVGLSWGY
jgi:hypothetical protein